MLWTPRVLGILMCAYLGMFALDAFDGGGGLLRTLVAFGMHLIPALVLLVVVIVSWRWEWVGAIVFIACALVYAYWARAHPSWVALIGGPLLIVGLAFLQSWLRHDELHAAT
jgi:hypothetical protein